jgi:uncharacterized protein with HEPN domain
MAGMRDLLIHKYVAVNLEVVWQTIHEDFPQVKPHLQQMVGELPDEGA